MPNALKAHAESVEAVVAALGSHATRGLTQQEARIRLERHGPNRLRTAPETPWWRRLLEQFEATFGGEEARKHSPKSATFLDGVKGFWDRMTSS